MKYKCKKCGEVFKPGQFHVECPKCGSTDAEVIYDYAYTHPEPAPKQE